MTEGSTNGKVIGSIGPAPVRECSESPGSPGTPAQVAAPKTSTRLMLTDLERVIFDRCLETGDTPDEALEYDEELSVRITKKVTKDSRLTRIQEKLELEPRWLKQLIEKLKAGVREYQDEPSPGVRLDETSNEALLAMRRGLDEASELHGSGEDGDR